MIELNTLISKIMVTNIKFVETNELFTTIVQNMAHM